MFLEVVKMFGNLILDTLMLILTDFRFMFAIAGHILVSYYYYNHYNEVKFLDRL